MNLNGCKLTHSNFYLYYNKNQITIFLFLLGFLYVQKEAIQMFLSGSDVLMTAETGSGETLAFCIPILQILWEI